MPYWMKCIFVLADKMLKRKSLYFDFKHVKFYASLKLKMTNCFLFLFFFFFDIMSRFRFRFSVSLKCSSCYMWRYCTWNKDIQVCRPCVLLKGGSDKVSDPMLLEVFKLQYLVPFSWHSLQLTADKDRIGVYERWEKCVCACVCVCVCV